MVNLDGTRRSGRFRKERESQGLIPEGALLRSGKGLDCILDPLQLVRALVGPSLDLTISL